MITLHFKLKLSKAIGEALLLCSFSPSQSCTLQFYGTTIPYVLKESQMEIPALQNLPKKVLEVVLNSHLRTEPSNDWQPPQRSEQAGNVEVKHHPLKTPGFGWGHQFLAPALAFTHQWFLGCANLECYNSFKEGRSLPYTVWCHLHEV